MVRFNQGRHATLCSTRETGGRLRRMIIVDGRKWIRGLIIAGLAVMVAWFGIQSAARLVSAEENEYQGMGGMMGQLPQTNTRQANVSDEDWQEMGALHARIHGGDPAQLAAEMKAMHEAYGNGGMMGRGMMGGMMGGGMMHGMMGGMSGMMYGNGYGGALSIPQDVDDDAPRTHATVTLSEWDLQPDAINGTDGEVLVLTIKNEGTVIHGLTIPGLGVSVPAIAPGDSTVIQVPLRSGTYDMYCPIPGHRQLGQTGTLVVE